MHAAGIRRVTAERSDEMLRGGGRDRDPGKEIDVSETRPRRVSPLVDVVRHKHSTEARRAPLTLRLKEMSVCRKSATRGGGCGTEQKG